MQLPQLKEAGLGSPQLADLLLEAWLVLLLLVQRQHQVAGLPPEIHPLMAEKPKPAGPSLPVAGGFWAIILSRAA